MKKLFLPLILLMVFAGCREKEDPEKGLVGQWDLISMENPWENTTLTGQEMTFQQSYQFNPDGTFVKIQVKDGETAEASGTYLTEREEIASSSDVKLNVLLDFIEGEEIAGHCVSGSEVLILRHNNQLINTWSACDGPRLTYLKN